MDPAAGVVSAADVVPTDDVVSAADVVLAAGMVPFIWARAGVTGVGARVGGPVSLAADRAFGCRVLARLLSVIPGVVTNVRAAAVLGVRPCSRS